MTEDQWNELKVLLDKYAKAYCEHNDACNDAPSRLNDTYFEEQIALSEVEKYVRKMMENKS